MPLHHPRGFLQNVSLYPDFHSSRHVPSRYPHRQYPIRPLVPGMICTQVNKASPITREPPAICTSYSASCSTSHYLPPTIILAPLRANFSDLCHTAAKGSCPYPPIIRQYVGHPAKRTVFADDDSLRHIVYYLVEIRVTHSEVSLVASVSID